MGIFTKHNSFDISANPSFFRYNLFKNIRIFEYLTLFEYDSIIFHSMNDISYSIWSILLRQIIFDIQFDAK